MLPRILTNLRLGFFAGILIAIGGAINLQCSSMGHPILGGVFFSFGLMCVCILGANLFTGKIGYVLANDRYYLFDVAIMSIGNVLGAMIVGYLCGVMFPDWTVSLPSKFIYGDGATWYNATLRALGAGVFVYLAVECFKRIENYPAKLIMVMLSIATMVILGCNHSIANVFYFAYAQIRVANFDALCAILSIIVAMLANGVGSILVYLLQHAIVIKPKNRA